MFTSYYLLLICFVYYSSAALTYSDCMADTTTQTYKNISGWCFWFKWPGWPPGIQSNSQSNLGNAQAYCGPGGVLAVGVTYKLMQVVASQMIGGQQTNIAFMAMTRNSAAYPAADKKSGWTWNTKLPDGSYFTFPAIWSNIYWTSGEPNNYFPPEDAFVIVRNGGGGDIESFFAIDGPQGSGRSAGVICQFVGLQSNYNQRGQGRFNVAAFTLANSTKIRLDCILACHSSLMCVSFAHNPTTQHCQLYAVSPEDPKFSANVTADSSYNWYIRDGLEY